MNNKPIGAGGNSFDIIDPIIFFSELNLANGSIFLDLGCGLGKYSIFASSYVGKEGLIYAVDLWEEGIKELEREIDLKKITNIKTMVTDISVSIPIGSESVDTCLMATVLHDLVRDNTESGTLSQVQKLIRSDGLLAILEFKKISPPPGPPLEIRLTKDQVDSIVSVYEFERIRNTDIGDYTYLSIYKKRADRIST